MTVDDLSTAAGPNASERWELAYQWRMLWRTLKYSVFGVLAFLTLLAVGQVYLFHQMFSDIHPFLGWMFIGVITGFFIWLVAIPLARFLNAPEISHPPDVNLKDPAITPAALTSRLHFDTAYLKSICANPALANKREEALKAREDLRILAETRDKALAGKLAAFESARIAVLLKDLDKQVDDYIHKEALAVGSATAVSMNGSIDAFIVLWRNINMISRISRLYYGRPSMRISLQVLRDVMMAVLLSRTLDDVSDMAGDALGKTVSRLGGMVAGPVMDGSVNALVTLKLGYLAKKRCRSFDVWSKSSAQTAVQEVFERVSRESTSLVGELVKMTGGVLSAAAKATGRIAGFATDAAGNVIAMPRSAWTLVQDAFIRKRKAEDQEGGA
jgi:putative membrane protein